MVNRVKQIGWIAALLLIGGWSSHAVAKKSVRVALGNLSAPGRKVTHLKNFQKALKRLGGIRIQSTKNFQKKAKRLGYKNALPDDSAALSEVAQALKTDVIIYSFLARPKRRRSKDRVFEFTIYAGNSGEKIATRSLKVRRGKLTKAVWADAALLLEDSIFDAAEASVAATKDRDRDRRDDRDRYSDRDNQDRYSDRDQDSYSIDPALQDSIEPAYEGSSTHAPPILRVHAGLSLLSRTFDYVADDESPLFKEGGIQYDSAIVPGLNADAEIFPLATTTKGWAKGLGLGLRFEKVFVRTEQAITLMDGTTAKQSLDTQHLHFVARLLYEYHLNESETAPRIRGHLGWGMLNFTVEDNDEYRGATYSFMDLGAGIYIPLGSPLFALDLDLTLLPFTSLGDSAEELGKDISTFGYCVYGGFGSEFGSGLSLRGGMEYTSFSSKVSGPGRGEPSPRIGKSASDSYLGIRLIGGYRF